MTMQFRRDSSANRSVRRISPGRRCAIYLMAAAFLGLCLANPCAAGDRIAWIRDLETGKKGAKAAGKDLLLVFPGHGWCPQCEHLDREVFQHSAFVAQARQQFVFVEFDLQFDDSPGANGP